MISKKIFLIGMMGCGKTTLGKKLSNILNLPFIDIDSEIEKKEKKSIENIFKENGETYFRTLEKKTLKEINYFYTSGIISTGGGIILDDENFNILKNEYTIFLYVSISELKKRLEKDTKRPLLKNKNIINIWEERKSLYNSFKKVNLSGLTINSSLEKLLKEIIN
ncbi:hypothetical protein OSSY52_17200 [Tepiditoga spiralis]|uniref:Shikimate kinase n=1 Tax=Tepiditoga spiralis TaxID=2108365 RepID=A0A7G1GC07_9BACT|nr:shikimate kinase [Tepiditoga spiralis]BBE31579.1 hypothetical protein OSSY52_17200 [Tepiditoga spiralis]